MANHSVAVAKASLIAPFVRPDPTSIPRDEVTAFHGYLETAIERCSPSNIQRCRAWLSANATSPNRITAVAKYFGILSASFSPDIVDQQPGTKAASSKRKRLHILYLINDWLHAGHHHQSNGTLQGRALGELLQPHLLNLVVLAAACDLKRNQKLKRRIDELLQYWQVQQYYDTAFVKTLREATLNAEQTLEKSATSGTDAKRDADSTAPFNLPALHGDASAPWHELPAANMLPHISPNSSFPIDAELVKPVRFSAGPADSSLVALVQDLVRESEILYGEVVLEQDGTDVDYDELGQTIMTTKDAGDISYGETYYGWSKQFCERMKRKQREGLPSNAERRRSRSVSRGRYSSSVSRSRSRSRSGRRRERPAFRRHSRSSSLGRSRSPQRAFRRTEHRSRSRSRSQPKFKPQAREKSYSPPDPTRAQVPATHNMNFSAPQDPMLQAIFSNTIPNFIPPPPPNSFSSPQPGSSYPQGQFPPPFPPHLAHFSQGGVPAPPPRPPNWQGPWPPLPPPPPGQAGAPFFGQQAGYQQSPPGAQPRWNQPYNAGQGPPPPPPPPPPGGWGGPGGQRWG